MSYPIPASHPFSARNVHTDLAGLRRDVEMLKRQSHENGAGVVLVSGSIDSDGSILLNYVGPDLTVTVLATGKYLIQFADGDAFFGATPAAVATVIEEDPGSTLVPSLATIVPGSDETAITVQISDLVGAPTDGPFGFLAHGEVLGPV